MEARISIGPDGQPRVRIDNAADLAAATVLMQQAGAIGQAHLLRALAAGRIAYLPLNPDTSASLLKSFTRATANRPAVVLIGDDDGLLRGPAAWHLAERAVRWPRSVMVHGAGAEIAHYEATVLAAQTIRRMLVIECGSATLPAWTALVRAAPHRPGALVIQPQGGVHPVLVPRERRQ